MTSAVGLLHAFALPILMGTAPAAPTTEATVQLDVQAAADCTSLTDLAARVGSRSSRIHFVDETAATSVKAFFLTDRSGSVSGKLVISGAGRKVLTRQVLAKTCNEAADAVALIIVVTLDPTSVMGRSSDPSNAEVAHDGASHEPTGTEAPKSTSETSAPTSPDTGAPGPTQHPSTPPGSASPKPSTPPSANAHASPWQLLLRAPEGKLDWLTMPSVGYGVGLGLGVKHASFRGAVATTFYPAQESTRTELAGFRFRYLRETFELFACQSWWHRSVDIAPCATLSLDTVRASASGHWVLPQSQRVTWISPGAGVSAYLSLHRNLSLVATAIGRITTNRERFVVAAPIGVVQVHELPWFSLNTSLGCEWTF